MRKKVERFHAQSLSTIDQFEASMRTLFVALSVDDKNKVQETMNRLAEIFATSSPEHKFAARALLVMNIRLGIWRTTEDA